MRASIPFLVMALTLPGAAPFARADTPSGLLATYATHAGVAAFDPVRGGEFFAATHGNDWSCASCHGRAPTAAGRHARTGKPIQPLAPAANDNRFTDPAKVEKWFRRNCNDVLGRACTAREKGDVLAWLMTLGK